MAVLIKHTIPLAPYTSFGIGGAAPHFTEVHSEDELVQALGYAKKHTLPVFILGGGSNILVGDKGFDGLVIHNRIKGIEIATRDETTYLSCGAGEVWDDIVSLSVSEGLTGLELLSGIPGTLGAAPVQNIGAYGTSMDSIFFELKAYDREKENFIVFSKKGCQFAYRSSIFKKEKDRYVITRVTLCLSDKEPIVPSYHDLKEIFRANTTPSSAEIRKAVLQVRAEKGMVILPGYESYKSAGSFFQNPVISKEQFETLKSIATGQSNTWRCGTPWYWEFSADQIKISAACLIQQAGFQKGYREGDVGLSPRHTLAIVNYDAASAEEILIISKKIINGVKNKFDITLEPEVQYIGPVDQ